MSGPGTNGTVTGLSLARANPLTSGVYTTIADKE